MDLKNDNNYATEFMCQKHLNENAPEVAPKLYEIFWIMPTRHIGIWRPRKIYQCVAMEIVGLSLNQVRHKLSIGLARKYTEKFVKGVETMYNAGVVHGGKCSRGKLGVNN